MMYLRFFLAFLFLGCTSCEINSQTVVPALPKVNKINGLSFVAASRPYAKEELKVLQGTHANHLAIMPFGFTPTIHSTELHFDHPQQWWGERSEGCTETIQQCKKEGFQIMLKPQLWIGGGVFTGFIEMNSEEEWKVFEKNYSNFILHFAKIAEEQQIEIYCIGTELGKFVAERPAYWSNLVKEVRTVYSGKLTYAENWDCFDKPNFLAELDFVGVDAYFPIHDGRDPSEEEIRAGWKTHLAKLEACSIQTGRPILFTECGYRSKDYAAAKPWDFEKGDMGVNQGLQHKLLKVMFELWEYDWMAGGYIWKWFPYHQRAGGTQDDQFTPQNKLAEKTIVDFYKTFVN